MFSNNKVIILLICSFFPNVDLVVIRHEFSNQRAPKEGGDGPLVGIGARPCLLKYSCTCLGISAKTCLASMAGGCCEEKRKAMNDQYEKRKI